MNKELIFICFKYPPEYSGYGKQLKSVLEKMNELEHDFNITILTAFKSSKIEEDSNIKVINLGTSLVKKNSLVFYAFCFKLFIWLFFKRNKYSIIHCIKAGPEAVVANLISKIFNKKLIVKVAQDELSERELKNVKGVKRFSRKLRQLLLKNTENFIAISEEISDNLKKTASEKSNILKIPNGVDNFKFSSVENSIKKNIRLKLDLPEDRVIILFAGAITKRKGIFDLLDAIIKIENQKLCTVIICGPILDYMNFENKLSEINLKNLNINIIYKGKVDCVHEYMKASDIFVLPSYSEGLPNVLLEAAASGLALVATDIGGSRDIVINNKTGFLVPINNSQSLSKKLEILIDSQERRDTMGREARILIKNKFALNHISLTYLELYKKLSNNK